jgi:transcriptional regulator of acetoin/glycerol metabolism
LKKHNITEHDQQDQLIKVLEETGGNRQKAAQLLGVSRVTLWKLLKKHGIKVQVTVKPVL